MITLQSQKRLRQETSEPSENMYERKWENIVPCHQCSSASELTEAEENRQCPGNEYPQSIEYCGHGVRDALGGTFQIKTTHNPIYNQEKKRIVDENVPRKFSNHPIDCPVTMPELKRMRKTNISIVRRTMRVENSPWRNEEHAALTRSLTVPDCQSLGVETKYNPAFEPDDEDDTLTAITRATRERSSLEAVFDRNSKLNRSQRSIQQQENNISNYKSENYSSNHFHPFLSEKQHESKEITTNLSLTHFKQNNGSISNQELSTRKSLKDFSRNHQVSFKSYAVFSGQRFSWRSGKTPAF